MRFLKEIWRLFFPPNDPTFDQFLDRGLQSEIVKIEMGVFDGLCYYVYFQTGLVLLVSMYDEFHVEAIIPEAYEQGATSPTRVYSSGFCRVSGEKVEEMKLKIDQYLKVKKRAQAKRALEALGAIVKENF